MTECHAPIYAQTRSTRRAMLHPSLRRGRQNRLRLGAGDSRRPQRAGRHRGHASASRAAEADRAEPGEDFAPDQRRHADLRDASIA